MRRTISTFALALAVCGLAAGASAQTVVNADITSDTTWSGTIILDQPIFVKDGATLTILPGTIVRGQPRSGPVVVGSTANTPGTLIVTQSGRIVAEGDADNPIIMTTAAVDNDNDNVADDDDSNGFEDQWVAGDTFLDDAPVTAPLAPLNGNGDSNVALWGGLVILGNAPTNNADKCSTPYGQCTVEGLTIPGFDVADASYGGLDPNDSSGSLRYVSVRHAGDEIGEGNELNGITLGGVGQGTNLEFLEVYANFDDGIEWFGGTASGSHLAVFFVGDDSIDVDEGYTGVNQFMFIVMPFFNENDADSYGSRSGDKAGEFDGDNFRPDNTALNDNVNVRINQPLTVVDATPWPLSNFQFWNVTAIGSTPDAGQEFTPVSVNSPNRGLQWRNGAAGFVFNSVVVNTFSSTADNGQGFDIDTGVGDGAPGFDAIDNVNAGLIALVCSTLDDGNALPAAEATAVANGDALATRLGGGASSANVVNSGGFQGLVNEDQTFDPQGNASGKLDASLKATPLNPRLAPGLTGIGGCTFGRTGGKKITPVSFRGAFDTQALELWTADWTVLSIGGLLAD